ncbi:MAG: helix-turn-helix domain-containing protein [Clostridia bacterium]|nr:helix-turn-helix domain-containing protein [Clostridia bacterium]
MILVISKSKRQAERLSEMLNIAGYLSYGLTPSQAISEISPRYRAVVIITDTQALPAPFSSVISACSAPALKIPVFAIGECTEPGVAEVFHAGVSVSSLLKGIIRYLVINEKPIIGKYKCAGFDASADSARVMYFDKEIRLTNTEKMILRFLTRSYPLPVTADKIIKNAIRPSRSPEPSSIRTHISMMNKKFKAAIGRQMIEFCDKEGYIIITPERKKGILK